MQNSSIDFFLQNIKKIQPPPKKLTLLEKHMGSLIIDFLMFKPSKLISARICKKIEDLEENNEVILEITILRHYQNYFNKKIPYKITSKFEGTNISLIFFSKFTAYLSKIFPINDKVFIKGKLENYKNNYQILHPQIVKKEAVLNKNYLHQVIYKQQKKLNSEEIHSVILRLCSILPELEEWNTNIFKYHKKLPSFKESILRMHCPNNDKDLSPNSPCLTRLAYDEIFAYQLSLAILRYHLNTLNSNYFNFNYIKIINYIKQNLLPFQLTQDQEKCVTEILEDIKSDKRTLRLLHGDVGSGKTIVAMIVAYYVIKSGYQVALLTPTELLATQHYNFFSDLFNKEEINFDLLLASSLNKKKIKQDLFTGQIKLIIGTHALLQKDVKFKNLSLVIIDEQHRFGVEQRISIRNKGKKVDMLLLTATPIPRTMMLTILGDIAVSTIKEKPFKSNIETILKNEDNLEQVITFLNKKMLSGQKVFWVCPKIEEEDSENNSNVEKRFDYLNKRFKKSARLHGKMNSKQKINVLNSFRTGKINLIVSTVVIEVGIDVPDANIIVIDNSNTFGLAQIHQLRGRVGRGGDKGICILLYKKNLSESALKRLLILKKTLNGFEVAEKDLEIRGGGQIMGTKQYGAEDFKFFDYQHHTRLAVLAIKEAKNIIQKDPYLNKPQGKKLLHLLKLFRKKDAADLISAG